jgi:hypothetical protein
MTQQTCRIGLALYSNRVRRAGVQSHRFEPGIADERETVDGWSRQSAAFDELGALSRAVPCATDESQVWTLVLVGERLLVGAGD